MHDLQKVVDADPKLTVNVNVSRIQLLQPALLDYTREFAESHPELVRNVILEITETAFMDERVDIVPILRNRVFLTELPALVPDRPAED